MMNYETHPLKIVYCSYSIIPSKTANSIAVMKQCAALDHRASLKVILIRGKMPVKYDELYGVQIMDVTLLPQYMLWFNELGLRIYVALYVLLHNDSVVYSRDVFINSTLCRFRVPNYYEIHQLKHNNNSLGFNKRFNNSLNRIANSVFTKKIICISNKLKNECVLRGIEKDKLFVLHSGVDLHDTQPMNIKMEMPKFANTQPVAVYSGSIQRGKGIDTIVAMAEIASNYNFMIVGGKIGDIKERANLKHIPFMIHQNIMKLLKLADYLLLPIEDNDCEYHSPLKLFEYLAAGKVIIASDNEDIREIITDGNNGMLAKPSDPQSFIEKMDIIAANNNLRVKIENNAKKTASNYTWGLRSESIIEMINRDLYHEKY